MNKRKILLVEDSPTQAHRVIEIVRECGFTVDWRTNGLEALDYLDENIEKLPDLIITDIVMPKMSGYELCNMVRQLYPDIMIIVVTVKKTNEEIQKAFDAGALEFISKPVRKPELIMRIRNVLKIREADSAVKDAASELSKTNEMLERLTVIDRVTKLFSRKHMIRDLQHKIYDLKRYGFKFSAILFDIDNFKNINNRFGHKFGDEVLNEISQKVLRSTRKTDVLGRYENDTFILLLPNLKLKESLIVAEKLRDSVSAMRFHNNPDLKLTICCGVVESSSDYDINTFITELEITLLRAKDKGESRIEY